MSDIDDLLRRTNERIEFANAVGKMSDIGYLESVKVELKSNQWISVEDRLPEPEQVVLAAVNGFDAPVVAHMLWECCNPMIESYFKDFLYWDDVHHDGQDFGEDVTHWMSCPAMPSLINTQE